MEPLNFVLSFFPGKSEMNQDNFLRRHLGPDETEIAEMLDTIGASSIEELVDQTVPAGIRLREPLPHFEPMSEYSYLRYLRGIASQNKVFRSYLGLGFYGTITPSVIQRNIFENPGWYTQYTPYQAEIAQGRLEALLNYQTMISDLTGMPVANASLLDEPTAAAEAMALAWNRFKKGVKGEPGVLLVSDNMFPQTLAVLQTRAKGLGLVVKVMPESEFTIGPNVFAAMVQYPDVNGTVGDYQDLADELHAHDAYLLVASDLMALATLHHPAAFGADVVFGSAQRFGVPMGFGGPHAAFFASREENLRLLPGRIIGVSIDAHGNRALRMALQTREQHIRRDKATSNICTAQALLAIMAGMYAVYHGPSGIRAISAGIHHQAARLDAALALMGLKRVNATFYDTLTYELSSEATVTAVAEAARSLEINLRENGKHIGVAVDETMDDNDLSEVVTAFAKGLGISAAAIPAKVEAKGYPEHLRRVAPFLTHPVFSSYHSETAMMRYIRSLEGKDLALNMAMIPLGSCTMKLNAATELMPLSWPEFAHIHPFAPVDQTKGYLDIIEKLGLRLCEITGFHGVSFQPNSGAQGEYAGLMVIQAYHESRGDHHRKTALIPASAHGTNPASAVMAGMQVVVVKTDELGNIDILDLEEKAEKFKDTLSCLMITYPSTFGVFEEGVAHICEVIHSQGGQVYMDGANMNAQVGLTSPGRIGADVCHLNLHKTFAIPHGGGGPGMGPICVAEHLTPFLPSHPLAETTHAHPISAVSGTPFGSPSILLISYGYIRLLGSEGLRRATEVAILNANYLKTRLEGFYPVVFQGSNKRVAHEFILDMRSFKSGFGLEVDDITKRLIDYGFHAPTVSWPVPGTIMIEPTESEPKQELDRFVDAMIAIRNEIQEVIDGTADLEDNVLRNSPHTQAVITADSWTHAYGREKAAFPVASLRAQKFWPTVARVNNTYGDRNIVCVCPPMEAYA